MPLAISSVLRCWMQSKNNFRGIYANLNHVYYFARIWLFFSNLTDVMTSELPQVHQHPGK